MTAGRSRLRGWRLISILIVSLLQCIAGYLLLRLRGPLSDRKKAEWLHRSCQFVRRRLGIRVIVEGVPPDRGLIVSNHLSYVDILIYGATLPCVFVSKAEVRSWPLLGLLASFGGTVFIDRGRPSSAAAAAQQITTMLKAHVPVLLFPEGTSSDGSRVLRFHASLFAPAVLAASPVTAASISYSAAPSAAEKDLCYYGDISFAPHLLKTLMLPQIEATLRFSALTRTYSDRKIAARESWSDVNALRERGKTPDHK